MATVTGTSTVGGHFVVSVTAASGKAFAHRFRNTSPDARSLVQYQTDCQTASAALADATVAVGPNATNSVMALR